MKLFTFVFLLLLTLAGHAQSYQKAIVTDLNFLRRSNVLVTEETFPFYFHHKDFSTDVQDEIRLLLYKKYGISDVLFFTPDSITYRDQSTTWDTQAKEYARVMRRENTLFISVETILQMYTQIEQERTYRFTTRVRAFNYDGKQVFKFKNHIPFTPVYGDEIAGAIDMGEQDFYMFYFDGLQYAFEGKLTTAPKRYVIKPMAEKYQPFTFDALKYYLETESNGYGYGSDFGRLSELLYFTINYWSSNSGEPFSFINLASIEYLDSGYNFINRLDEEEYTVRMKGGVNNLQNAYDPYVDLTWELLTSKGDKLSNLVYNGESDLNGKYLGQDISFQWKNGYSCLEVFVEGNMLALINYSATSKVLYLSREITREQLIMLANCIFIYDYSQAVRKKIVFKYD